MLSVQVDEAKGVAILEPEGALSKDDFARAAKAIDPHISFGALASHLKFVRGHHRKIRRVAPCTDSAIGKVAPRVARHFVAAELELAKAWAAGEG